MIDVPMNDLTWSPSGLLEAELSACEDVIRSGWWILGAKVEEFEKRWAAWIDSRYGVGCANGLDAIEMGLRAIGVGAGDEVITTPMTAFATGLGIIRAGATPVLADIQLDTAMLDIDSVKRCITKKTKAILLVHLYGQIGPVIELRDLANEHGLQLIEDCAQAHGASLSGVSAGKFGTFAAWSFYPTKNLGAVGDAGALTTDVANIAESARVIRNYGQSERYQHPIFGMNSRLDELQAALLLAKIEHLPDWINRRRQVAKRYAAEIRNEWVELLPLPDQEERHSHHLFVIRCRLRNELRDHLRSRGVATLIHYPIPMHLQESCRNIKRDSVGLQVSERHGSQCLSLPCHPGLNSKQVDQVIAATNCFKG